MVNTMVAMVNLIASCCYIVVYVLLSTIYCAKLNVPRVLLPFNLGTPSNFSLVISNVDSNDCFEWHSSAPHFVLITPIYTSTEKLCSQEATVSAVSRSSETQIVYVIAEHNVTPDKNIYCEVISDSIYSIEATSTTSEIYLGSPPEVIKIVAKNQKGHIFSSLNGVEFQWKLSGHDSLQTADGSVIDHGEALRLIRFADSSYKSPNDIQAWECRGLQSYVVLVEGKQAGTGILKAKLKHLAYANVNESVLSLRVVPNLRLNPAYDLYILPEATVHYKLETIKEGRPFELPLSDYDMKIKNTKIVKFSKNNEATGLQLGETTVVAKSKYDDSFAITSGIHVVEPSYMVLHVSPGESWALEEVKNYEVSFKLYDVRHHPIYPSDNLQVKVTFPNRLFYVNASSLNGTYYFVRTVVPGSGTIKAELKGVTKKDGTISKITGISASQKVIVYQSIRLTPSFVLLPWNFDSPSKYEIHLTAAGGTGFYTWISSNNADANITYQIGEQSNKAVVHIHNAGDFVITAVDMHNSYFSSSTKLSVQPIVDIEIHPTIVEAQLGNEVIVPVGLQGFEDKEQRIYRVFDDCSKVNISVDVVEKNKVVYNKDAEVPPFGRGCLTLQFLCKNPGHSRVNLQLGTDDEKSLKTTLVIACHKSLKPIHPVRVAALALGTSIEIAFEGGPRPWPLYHEGHYIELIADKPELMHITILKDPVRYNKDLHIFKVVCQELGESMLKFKIGNHPSPTNPNPARLESSIKVICGVPNTLHMEVKEKNPKRNKNPVSSDITVVKVPFYGNKLFEVDLWLKDSVGRKFANISSYSVYWEVSDYSLAKPRDYRDFRTYVDGSAGYKKTTRNFQEFEMTGGTGPLKVTAKLQGYRTDILKKQHVKEFPPLEEISQSINLQLVSLRDTEEWSFFSQGDNKEKDTCDGDSCQS